MIIPNNTHYFNEFSKLYNQVPDSSSFQYESSRRQACYQRLYFEFEYTKLVGGITFYYTCTYNNKSIPMFLGHPCFSYKDIRLITNGSIPKELDRKYGSRMKYFCACESGEGKGQRGFGNNPHYHFIFFVQPKHDKEDKPIFEGYRQISPTRFDELIKDLWQGKHSYIPFQKARFGICKEGKYGNVVHDISAFRYVGKYILKDEQEKTNINFLEAFYKEECLKLGPNAQAFWVYYKILSSTSFIDKYDFMQMFDFQRYHAFYKRTKDEFPNYTYYKYVEDYCSDEVKVNCIQFDNWFSEFYVGYYVNQKLSYYKTNYSGKVRCSKSLGIYGLHFINDVDSKPWISVPNGKKQYKVESPCLFYIRHLYYDVVKCPVTGNPLYRLNRLGIDLKVNSLSYHINKTISSVKSAFSYFGHHILPLYKLQDDRIIFSKSDLLELMNHPDLDRLLYTYSVYHHVYRYRLYSAGQFYLTEDYDFKSILSDYALILRECTWNIDYNICTVYHTRLFSTDRCLRSFSNFPFFKPFVHYYDMIDSILDHVSSIQSDISKANFKKQGEALKRMNAFVHNAMVTCDMINGPFEL